LQGTAKKRLLLQLQLRRQVYWQSQKLCSQKGQSLKGQSLKGQSLKGQSLKGQSLKGQSLKKLPLLKLRWHRLLQRRLQMLSVLPKLGWSRMLRKLQFPMKGP